MKPRVVRSESDEYLKAAGIVMVATVACLALRSRLASIDVVMILLLGVVAAAATHRRGPALVASLLSIAAFDLLFVPPYGTFNVFDTAYYLTFGVMLLVALTMSGLTSRIREQREAAAQRERHTSALYAMETDLAAAPDLEAVRTEASRHLGKLVGGRGWILLTDTPGDPNAPALPEEPVFDDAEVRVAAASAWTHQEPAGWGTPRGREVPVLFAPLLAGGATIGFAAVAPDDAEHDLPRADRETLSAMFALAAHAIERRQLAKVGEHARREIEAERLRTALLSSLSHDLRTPLAGIEGSASTLLDQTVTLGSAVQRELLESIIAESRRMTRLVGNLLDMVRVETGTLAVRKSWQPLEEPLGVALLRMEARLAEHPVTTRLPSDLPMVPIDELLIEQVFLNLLENAVRYTPPGTAITITAWPEAEGVTAEVADSGPGVRPGDEEAMFERFRRGPSASLGAADAGAGAGLGLTICRGIIRAHGGRIWIEPGSAGGTVIRFHLPGVNVPEGIPTVEAVTG
ncbi:MAG: DUF4118 domain-containing protein [Gemmatimonadota bacterium]